MLFAYARCTGYSLGYSQDMQGDICEIYMYDVCIGYEEFAAAVAARCSLLLAACCCCCSLLLLLLTAAAVAAAGLLQSLLLLLLLLIARFLRHCLRARGGWANRGIEEG